MTEKELYRRIAPWLKRVGYPLRIEDSISTGYPDVILAMSGLFVALELKIQKGNMIVVRKFQGARATEMTPIHVPHPQYWFVVQKDNEINLYTWSSLKKVDTITHENNTASFMLNGIRPDAVWDVSLDVVDWAERILSNEYSSRRK